VKGHLRANLWLLALTVLVCCVLYPLVVWAVGQTAFPDQAQGSLIYGADGKTVIGSRLIGQPFKARRYFQPRPSATSPGPYNAAASGGSNLAASNPELRKRVVGQIEQLRTDHPQAAPTRVPADMVLASGSGLDPHITYENAMYQAPFVAEARRKPRQEIEALIEQLAVRPIGFLPIAGGERIVNVLDLNLALDR
jgi:K+-transporting ATPase ATPase C chain